MNNVDRTEVDKIINLCFCMIFRDIERYLKTYVVLSKIEIKL
jgi:hypothetical protein